MDKLSILFAKIAALQRNFNSLHLNISGRVFGNNIEQLIDQYFKLDEVLRKEIPELYSDLPEITYPTPTGQNDGLNLYEKRDVKPVALNIDYILEVRANYRIGERNESEVKKNRIFISHGKSNEWYKVQSHLEKTLEIETLELAQEANIGRTILQKLDEESSNCTAAIIVMTGDDVFEQEVRARENVLHEIGFFQGKYGLRNVIILHEEGASIPSNIHGLVYIPFPKETVEVTFGALQRELNVIIG